MTAGFYVRQVARECRGAATRLSYFVGCLAIGVAAVTAVASLSHSLDRGIRSEARELIGADVVISARREMPPEVDAAIADVEGARQTAIRDQAAVVAAAAGPTAGRTVLTDLMILDGPYPFYGSLDLDPPRAMEDALDEETIIVAPEVLTRLGISIGNSVNLGGASFRIAAVARTDPGRITGFMYFGPRAYVTREGFERTSLVDLRTRVGYTTLVKLDDNTPGEAQRVADALAKELERFDYVRVESYTDGRPELRRGVEQLDEFLGLIALLSLLLGGVGVAQAVRTWIATRLDTIAVLKCIGLRPREVLALYVGQAVLLGFAGSLIGVAIAFVILSLLPPLVSDIIPADLIDPWQPPAMLRGFALGVGVALLFSVPPLIAVLRVPPSRVFRRDAEPLPEAQWVPFVTAAVLMIGVAIMAVLQADSPIVGLQFTGGVLGTALVLALAAWGIARGAARLPRDFGRVWLRYGLAALGRPGASTVASMVGIGLGVLVLFTTHQIQLHLNHQLTSQLPEKAPSVFLADIQPDQWDDVQAVFDEFGATDVQAAPLIMARVAAIDGRPIEELIEESKEEEREGRDEEREFRRGRREGDRDLLRANRREQFLTYLEELPNDNEIIEGEWWSDPDAYELSIDDDVAEDLELEIGTIVTFETIEKTVELKVTSIRKVNWDDFNINFQYVVEPGVFDETPYSRIAAAWLPPGTQQAVQDRVVGTYPNITFLQIGRVLDRIVVQLERISWGVRFLGLFIIAAGLAVLTGTIGVESQRRGREVALLKTLGMTRPGVAGVFATEYALVGAASGLIGTLGGAVAAWIAVTRALEVEWMFYPGTYLFALFGTAIIAVVAGTGASGNALRRRPIEVLRHEE